MKLIYLDNAATTPTDERVVRAMNRYLTLQYGNAGSIYGLGRQAKSALEKARHMVAKHLGAHASEIYFTAGGTESDNLAVLGYARAHRDEGKHIITTRIEHPAVLEACRALEKEGFKVTYLPVDKNGLVSAAQVAKAIRPDTILISIIYANNEIGTVEPIRKIGQAIANLNARRAKNKIAFHTDACQAAGYLNLKANDLKVDLLTINGSKIYGPKGVGALYVRQGLKLEPLIFGGGQERGLRSGTENVAGAVGLAQALDLVSRRRVKESQRLTKLRDYFVGRVLEKIPRAVLNSHSTHRLPNNANISFWGIEGESAVLYLDARSIAAATGSACSSTHLEPSHVIMALGRSYEFAHGSLRFSLGQSTTKKDLDYVVDELVKVVARLRQLSALEEVKNG